MSYCWDAQWEVEGRTASAPPHDRKMQLTKGGPCGGSTSPRSCAILSAQPLSVKPGSRPRQEEAPIDR
jgi:hypothetical protein